MRISYPPFLIGTLLWLCLSCSALSGNIEVARKLRDARVELAVAEGVHQRVESDFREMQKDPSASPEEVLAMEAYVKELEEMVHLRKSTLDDLTVLADEHSTEVDPTISEGVRVFDEAVDQVPDTKEPESEEERLDREFRASLEEFDGMILAHNQKLEAKMDARIAQGEAAAGNQQSAVEEAQALLKSMGVETGEPSEKGETATGTEVAGQQEGSAATGDMAEGSASTVKNGSQGTQPGEVGASRPPVDDEDIVARQLREAAEKETDPVLREKLWKEYEAYLDGRS